MPSKSPASSGLPQRRSDPGARERRAALIVRLQIAAAVFGPMLLLGIWLQSRGFFASP